MEVPAPVPTENQVRVVRRRPKLHPLITKCFPLLVFFMFCIFSGLLEKTPGIRSMKLIAITCSIGLLVLIMTGRVFKVIKTPIAEALLAFTVWFILCVPFARWIGGSIHIFVEKWYKTIIIYILVAGLITTVAQARKLFHTLAYAVGILAIITLALRGYDQTGRLCLLGTRYANANDFAVALLMGIIFLALLYMTGTRTQKRIAVFLLIPVLLALAKTGSRAGMLGFAILAFYAFMKASPATKSKIAVGFPLIVIVLAATLSGRLRDRYLTLFQPAGSSAKVKMEEQEAALSARLRLQLLKDSIIITMMHPIFGVGPGDFMVAQDDLAKSRGEYGLWHLTHNTYTQLSSEMGIPGLILYIVFLYQVFKTLRSVARTRRRGRTWSELRFFARALQSTIVVMAIVIFFDAVAYDINVPILAGLATALGFIAQDEWAADESSAAKLPSSSAPPAPLEPALAGRY